MFMELKVITSRQIKNLLESYGFEVIAVCGKELSEHKSACLINIVEKYRRLWTV